MSLKFQLEGTDDLERAMKAIGKKAARQAAFVAVQHACEPIVKIAKAKARKRTGALADSISFRVVDRARKTGAVTGIIGPRWSYRGKDGSQPARTAHLIEKGHANKGGGSTPAYPFLRPAIDTGTPAALAALGKTFDVALSVKIDALPEVKKARLKRKKK